MNDVDLVFPTFKARNDLSYADIAKIFGVSVLTARAWSEGDAPDDMIRVARVASYVSEKAREAGMDDSTKQYYEKDKSNYIQNAKDDIYRIEAVAESMNCIFEGIKGSFWTRLRFLFNPSAFMLRLSRVDGLVKDGIEGIKSKDGK